MKKSLLILICFTAIFGLRSTQAQIIEYNITPYTIDDGLSNNTVNAVLQDSYGFIWATTENGLNRFDGREMVNYYVPDSLTEINTSSYFKCIAEDSNGNIWITAYPTGIFCYKRKYNRLFHASQFVKGWQPEFENVFDNLISVNNNSIFFSSDSIIFRISTEDYSLSLTNFTKRVHNTIGHIRRDNSGNLWIFSRQKKLFVYNAADDSLTGFTQLFAEYVTDSDVDVADMCTDSHDNIFICTGDSRIIKISDNLNIIEKCLDSILNGKTMNPYNILIDHNDRIWIEIDFSGFICLDQEFREINEYRLFERSGDNRIYKIVEDKNGNIWAGTNSNGLFRINNDNKIKNYTISSSPGLSDNFVPHLLEDQAGNIWAGTLFGGINKISKNKFGLINSDVIKVKNFKSVYSISFDKDGSLWAGTYGNGLIRINKQLNSAKSFEAVKENNVRQFLKDNKGNYWIGSRTNGLYYYNNSSLKNYSSQSFTNSAFWGQNILKIFEDGKGIIWVGTLGGGLYRFNHEGEILKRYLPNDDMPGSIKDYSIRGVIEDHRKNIWILAGKFLQKYNPDGDSFSVIDFNALDTSKRINSSLFTLCETNRGDLLIGTYGEGILKYNPLKSTLKIIDTKDGLASNLILGILSDKYGNIWVSSDKAISLVSSDESVIINYSISDGLQGKEYYFDSYCKGPDNRFYFGGVSGITVFNPSEIGRDSIAAKPIFTKFKKNNETYRLYPDITVSDTITISYYDKLISFETAVMNYTSPLTTEISYLLEGLNDRWINNGNSNEIVFTNLEPGRYNLKVRAANSDGIWSNKLIEKSITVIPPFWLTSWFKILVIVFILAIIVGLYRFRIKNIERINQLKLDKLKALDNMRIRIASDLHDELGSTLGTISILSKSITKNSNLEKDVRSKIRSVNNLTVKAAESMREIIWFIKPENNNPLEVIMHMKNFAAQLFGNINYSILIDEAVFKDLKVEDIRNMYLIFKECSHNIVKHSRATNVEIGLQKRDDKIYFSIKDNGIGCDLNESFDRGNGLRNIEKRCSEINWSVEFKTSYKSGMEVIMYS